MSTVVVIEEDTAMRALICEWLRSEGHHVLPRPRVDVGTEAAIDADLVIADLPNLRASGAQTVQEIRRKYPHSRIIGLSTQLGTSMPAGSHIARKLGICHLVAKPCPRAELITAVSHVTGSRG